MAISLKKALADLPADRRRKIDARAKKLIAEEHARSTSATGHGTRFHVFKDTNGEWRWRLIAVNGRIIASSGEGYKAVKSCLSSIDIVKSSGAAEVLQD